MELCILLEFKSALKMRSALNPENCHFTLHAAGV